MIFQKANQFLRKGKMQEALKEYKKIKTDSPLYQQAKFNIDFIEKKLFDSGIQLSTVQKSYDNISTDCENPLVSVVMPVFNVAPYLDASILSVLNQTYQNIELIIVDDASTDNGMNIIKMYDKLDSRIKVISLEFNTLGGAGIPSNIGVSAAKGKYVAYADSDDILNKNAIANFLKAAEENDAEVVIADFCNFNDDSREFKIAYDKNRWETLPLNKSFLPSNYPQVFKLSPVPWRKLYNRSYLEENQIRFPEGDYFYEDNPLHWFVLSAASRVVLIDDIVAYHRMERSGQTMSAGAYKLSAMLNHISSIRRKIRDSKQPNIKNEFVYFVVQSRWVINRQSNLLLRKIFSKRFYQELSKNDFTNLDYYKSNIGKIRPLKESYPDLDLTIVIMKKEGDSEEYLLKKLKSYKELKYNVFIICPKDESAEEVEDLSFMNVNVLKFNIGNGNSSKVINSVLPLCIGKYSLFMHSNFDSLNLVPKLVSHMKLEKIDLMYPEQYNKFEEINTLIIRNNHMRDVGIYFHSLLSYDFSFICTAYAKTSKKEASSLFDSFYKSEILNNNEDNIEGEFIKIIKLMNLKLNNYNNNTRFILKVLADIERIHQNNMSFSDWKLAYEKEYQMIIGYLEEIGEEKDND